MMRAERGVALQSMRNNMAHDSLQKEVANSQSRVDVESKNTIYFASKMKYGQMQGAMKQIRVILAGMTRNRKGWALQGMRMSMDDDRVKAAKVKTSVEVKALQLEIKNELARVSELNEAPPSEPVPIKGSLEAVIESMPFGSFIPSAVLQGARVASTDQQERDLAALRRENALLKMRFKEMEAAMGKKATWAPPPLPG